MKQWHLLYTTSSFPEASIIKGMLEENQIEVMLLNKQDSSYLNFGEIELYVPEDITPVANSLLEKALMN